MLSGKLAHPLVAVLRARGWIDGPGGFGRPWGLNRGPDWCRRLNRCSSHVAHGLDCGAGLGGGRRPLSSRHLQRLVQPLDCCIPWGRNGTFNGELSLGGCDLVQDVPCVLDAFGRRRVHAFQQVSSLPEDRRFLGRQARGVAQACDVGGIETAGGRSRGLVSLQLKLGLRAPVNLDLVLTAGLGQLPADVGEPAVPLGLQGFPKALKDLLDRVGAFPDAPRAGPDLVHQLGQTGIAVELIQGQRNRLEVFSGPLQVLLDAGAGRCVQVVEPDRFPLDGLVDHLARGATAFGDGPGVLLGVRPSSLDVVGRVEPLTVYVHGLVVALVQPLDLGCSAMEELALATGVGQLGFGRGSRGGNGRGRSSRTWDTRGRYGRLNGICKLGVSPTVVRAASASRLAP